MRVAETAPPASFVLGLQRTAGNYAVTEAITQGRLARDFTPAPAPGVTPAVAAAPADAAGAGGQDAGARAGPGAGTAGAHA